MTTMALALIASTILTASSSQEAPAYDPRDALAPTTSRDLADTGPLGSVTIATASLEETRLFYEQGLGLTVEGPIAQSEDEQAAFRALWGVEEEIGWDLYVLSRAATPDAFTIRLLVLDRPTPAILSSWEPRQNGPFSIGFPTDRAAEVDRRIRDLGFGARNAMSEYEIPRTDGTRYPIHETIFNAPDFLHAVNIYRGGDMAPLGPIDPDTGFGGPGYSAWVVSEAQPVLDFFTGVLGLELRSDRDFPSGSPDGAMRNIPGTVFRFSILMAHGHPPGGHLLIVDFLGEPEYAPNAQPRLPHRGLAMWSFPVRDLDVILERARRQGAAIIHEPVRINAPALGGAVRAAVLEAPEGMRVELYEAAP